MAPKGPEYQGVYVIYIPISVSDAPVFPLPPPPLAGLVVQIGTHTRSRRRLIAPAAPAAPPLLSVSGGITAHARLCSSHCPTIATKHGEMHV